MRQASEQRNWLHALQNEERRRASEKAARRRLEADARRENAGDAMEIKASLSAKV